MSQTDNRKDRKWKTTFPYRKQFSGEGASLSANVYRSLLSWAYIFQFRSTCTYYHTILFLHFHIPNIHSILYRILCKILDIPRILRTLIYFKTVNIIIIKYEKCYKITWLSPKFQISLTQLKIPWLFPDLEFFSFFIDFSLNVGTLK